MESPPDASPVQSPSQVAAFLGLLVASLALAFFLAIPIAIALSSLLERPNAVPCSTDPCFDGVGLYLVTLSAVAAIIACVLCAGAAFYLAPKRRRLRTVAASTFGFVAAASLLATLLLISPVLTFPALGFALASGALARSGLAKLVGISVVLLAAELALRLL